MRLAVYDTPFLPIGKVILRRLAPSRVLVDITPDGLKGFRMSANLNYHKYYWVGTYELVVQKVLKRVMRPGWICYDIAAHISYFFPTIALLVGDSGKSICVRARSG